jgi:hypothetical protein
MMKRNLIMFLGIIALAIIALYFFGMGSTNLELAYDNGSYDINDSGMNKEITTLNISGTTESYATVTINGESVPVDKNGNFYKVIVLKNGTNIYYVNAKAPFKSTNQINVTTNRIEDADGSVSGNWHWNATPKMGYY